MESVKKSMVYVYQKFYQEIDINFAIAVLWKRILNSDTYNINLIKISINKKKNYVRVHAFRSTNRNRQYFHKIVDIDLWLNDTDFKIFMQFHKEFLKPIAKKFEFVPVRGSSKDWICYDIQGIATSQELENRENEKNLIERYGV